MYEYVIDLEPAIRKISANPQQYIDFVDMRSKSYMGNGLNERIVRCKDCKFSEEMCDGRISCLGYLTEPWDYHNDQPNYTWVRPDGFCSWGERRKDDCD